MPSTTSMETDTVSMSEITRLHSTGVAQTTSGMSAESSTETLSSTSGIATKQTDTSVSLTSDSASTTSTTSTTNQFMSQSTSATTTYVNTPPPTDIEAQAIENKSTIPSAPQHFSPSQKYRTKS